MERFGFGREAPGADVATYGNCERLCGMGGIIDGRTAAATCA